MSMNYLTLDGVMEDLLNEILCIMSTMAKDSMTADLDLDLIMLSKLMKRVLVVRALLIDFMGSRELQGTALQELNNVKLHLQITAREPHNIDPWMPLLIRNLDNLNRNIRAERSRHHTEFQAYVLGKTDARIKYPASLHKDLRWPQPQRLTVESIFELFALRVHELYTPKKIFMPIPSGKLANGHPAMDFLRKTAGPIRILGIVGAGGTGKTTLLFRIMMRAGLGESEQVVYGELPGEQPDSEAIMRVQASMLLQLGGVGPTPIKSLSIGRRALGARLKSVVAAKTALFVAIDNVWRAQDLKRLLPIRILAALRAPGSDMVIAISSRVHSMVDALQTIILRGGREIKHIVPAFISEQKPLAPAAAKLLFVAQVLELQDRCQQWSWNERFGKLGRAKKLPMQSRCWKLLRPMGELPETAEVAAPDVYTQLLIKVAMEWDDVEYSSMSGGIPLALKRAGSVYALHPDIFLRVQEMNIAKLMRHILAGDRKIVSALEKSLHQLGVSSKRALVDIARFLDGWKWDTVGSLVGEAELNELHKYSLVEYRVQQDEATYLELLSCFRVHVIMPDLVLELDRREGHAQIRTRIGHFGIQQGDLDFSTVRYMQLDVASGTKLDSHELLMLDATCFASLHNLLLLDMTGSFECDMVSFPNSLRYIRFAHNFFLGHQLTEAELPVNLRHFELRDCPTLLELPVSIYNCTDLHCLILSDCPRLQAHGFNYVWKSFVELQVEECPQFQHTLISLDAPSNMIRYQSKPKEMDRFSIVIGDEGLAPLRSRVTLLSNQCFHELTEQHDEYGWSEISENDSDCIEDQLCVGESCGPTSKAQKMDVDTEATAVFSSVSLEVTTQLEEDGLKDSTEKDSIITDEIKQKVEVGGEECPHPSRSGQMMEVLDPISRSLPDRCIVKQTRNADTEDGALPLILESSSTAGLDSNLQITKHLKENEESHKIITGKQRLHEEDAPRENESREECTQPVTSGEMLEVSKAPSETAEMKQKKMSRELEPLTSGEGKDRLLHKKDMSSSDGEKLTLRDYGFHDLEEYWEKLTSTDYGKLSTLKLEYCWRLQRLPQCILSFHSLQVLKLHGCSDLQELPMEMGRLTALETLEVHTCQRLKELPETLSTLTSLVELSLCACARLKVLPDNIGELSGRLKTLCLSSCKSLSSLPESTSKLISLVQLDVQGCNMLKELPMRMGSLYDCDAASFLKRPRRKLELKVLSLDDCSQFRRLPRKLRNFKKLTILSLAKCQSLKNLSNSICDLNSLVLLDLQGCSELQKLPRGFGSNLSSLELLRLTDCQSLRRLPSSICRLDALTELDMMGCSTLEWLPGHVGTLSKLKKLKLANCTSLRELPDSICELESLLVMDMHGCYKLQELPKKFGKLRKLEMLDLRNCGRLKSFPHVNDSSELQSLRELDLRSSHLEHMLAEKGDLYFVGSDRVRSFFVLWREYYSKHNKITSSSI